MNGLRLTVLALLWSLPGLAPATSEASGPDARRIQLKMESAVTPSEIRISPGIATLLLFDSALDRTGTMLEGRESFREVDVGERTLVLLPAETLRDNEKFLLTVHFADAQTPATALFILKPHPTLAERQIEVYRHSSTCETCIQQAREQQIALDQCREQLSRCAATPHLSPSIAELRASEFIGLHGLRTRRLPFPSSSHELLEVKDVWSFRASERVAVEVRFLLKPPASPHSWVAKSATLIDRQGKSLEKLIVRQSEPENPEDVIHVWVEAETRPSPTAYTLTLKDEGGAHPLTVDNVWFP